jgi:hypothetical protein
LISQFDAAQTVVARYSYDAFGNVHSECLRSDGTL